MLPILSPATGSVRTRRATWAGVCPISVTPGIFPRTSSRAAAAGCSTRSVRSRPAPRRPSCPGTSTRAAATPATSCRTAAPSCSAAPPTRAGPSRRCSSPGPRGTTSTSPPPSPARSRSARPCSTTCGSPTTTTTPPSSTRPATARPPPTSSRRRPTSRSRYTLVDPAATGRWDPVIELPNVGIHASVLPDGRVLMWGRRIVGTRTSTSRRVPRSCGTTGPVRRRRPRCRARWPAINLFCAGHTFLADGRLLVMGGHAQRDGAGIAQSCVYDPATDTWTPGAPMNNGRWYPTALALRDGRVLVLSGSFEPPGQGARNNNQPQVWADGGWQPFSPLPDAAPFELYPRMHSAPNGRLVMSGPAMLTWSVGAAGGPWQVIAQRTTNQRDYCPAVTYGRGRVVYLGGGNDEADSTPTPATERLDLTQPAPRVAAGPAHGIRPAAAQRHPAGRRHHPRHRRHPRWRLQQPGGRPARAPGRDLGPGQQHLDHRGGRAGRPVLPRHRRAAARRHRAERREAGSSGPSSTDRPTRPRTPTPTARSSGRRTSSAVRAR